MSQRAIPHHPWPLACMTVCRGDPCWARLEREYRSVCAVLDMGPLTVDFDVFSEGLDRLTQGQD